MSHPVNYLEGVAVLSEWGFKIFCINSLCDQYQSLDKTDHHYHIADAGAETENMTHGRIKT